MRVRTLGLVAALLFGCSGSYGNAKLPATLAQAASRSLQGREVDVIAERGFVITEDRAPSFHYGYTALFKAHQPVYVTADALLEAWHASYDVILKGLEQHAMIPALQTMLGELRNNLQRAPAGDDEAREDIDTYLAVAESLASGNPASSVTKGDARPAAAIVERALRAAGPGKLGLFGRDVDFDDSMLKPRGHYTESVELERYFRAMSWLGRVEIRLARKQKDRWMADRRAVRAATLLRALFTPRAMQAWKDIDGLMGSFVGPSDSMSLPGFDQAAKTLGDVARASDDALGAAFSKEAGQKIGTQLAYRGDESIAFVTLGQRYVFDSHVFSAVTYGQLRQYRMMPSPLDVAATVFHHAGARALLEPQIATYGREYADALDDLSQKATAAGPALWKGSLYHLWLDALRELSPQAERDRGLPAPLSSESWGRRLLNTQLASWAELRHDNLLYAKQSVTAMIACDYPDGYVDPYPGFFGALEALAAKGRDAVGALSIEPSVKVQYSRYFEQFRAVAGQLREMAEKERRNEPLNEQDIDYLNHMVSLTGRTTRGGYGTETIVTPQGWYADLYFDRDDVLWNKPVVADVHTQPTDETGRPVGRVLHVGTASPRMLVVTIQHDGGKNTRSYRGFVSTYLERTTENYQRLTDADWRGALEMAPPPPPAWIRPILP
ncbi:DUF3160 domain-containing protein [Pendulispora rubella]|uniref:DUF3160 domain-containing protein n=1 Tax=Pendulispora rubella TaxID=2741070 RepID=A0ABZ2LAC4_9BACT